MAAKVAGLDESADIKRGRIISAALSAAHATGETRDDRSSENAGRIAANIVLNSLEAAGIDVIDGQNVAGMAVLHEGFEWSDRNGADLEESYAIGKAAAGTVASDIGDIREAMKNRAGFHIATAARDAGIEAGERIFYDAYGNEDVDDVTFSESAIVEAAALRASLVFENAIRDGSTRVGVATGQAHAFARLDAEEALLDKATERFAVRLEDSGIGEAQVEAIARAAAQARIAGGGFEEVRDAALAAGADQEAAERLGDAADAILPHPEVVRAAIAAAVNATANAIDRELPGGLAAADAAAVAYVDESAARFSTDDPEDFENAARDDSGLAHVLASKLAGVEQATAAARDAWERVAAIIPADTDDRRLDNIRRDASSRRSNFAAETALARRLAAGAADHAEEITGFEIMTKAEKRTRRQDAVDFGLAASDLESGVLDETRQASRTAGSIATNGSRVVVAAGKRAAALEVAAADAAAAAAAACDASLLENLDTEFDQDTFGSDIIDLGDDDIDLGDDDLGDDDLGDDDIGGDDFGGEEGD